MSVAAARDGNECGAGRVTPLQLLRRFRRDRKGVAAIEFVLLAPLFFFMLFAIVESCIAFAAQELITNAADDVARQFRTGRLKATDMSSVKLRGLLCERMSILFPDECPELKVDLRSFATFEEAARLFEAGVVPSEYTVAPGPALSKNVMRVVYRWPVITDIFRKALSDQADGKILLFATATWQNEPFND